MTAPDSWLHRWRRFHSMPDKYTSDAVITLIVVFLLKAMHECIVELHYFRYEISKMIQTSFRYVIPVKIA